MTSKNSAPRIRLSPVGTPGASLYNAYHLLSQVATLYSRGGELDRHPEAATVWTTLCDGVLADLGEVYTAWEAVLNATDKPAAALDDKRLGDNIARACLRIDAALFALNIWSPLSKWLTLARLAERRWQRIAAEIAEREPRVKPGLTKARLASQERSSRVTGLWETHEKHRQQMAQSGKLASQMAGGGESS